MRELRQVLMIEMRCCVGTGPSIRRVKPFVLRTSRIACATYSKRRFFVAGTMSVMTKMSCSLPRSRAEGVRIVLGPM